MAWITCEDAGDQWFTENAVDTATLTGTSVAGLGVERLKDPRVGVKWRPPSGGTSLGIFFPTPIRLDVFAIFGLSSSNVDLTLRISTTGTSWDYRDGPWTPAISTSMQALWLNSRDGSDPAPMVTSIALGVGAQVDIGRVWAGPWMWAPQANHTIGARHGIEDLSSVQRTRRSGAVFADRAARLRTAELPYDLISEEEMQDEVYLLGRAGTSNQILFVPDFRVYPIETFALLGYQEPVNPITAMTFDRWSRSFTLKEAG